MKKYAAIITGITVAVLLSQTNLFNEILLFFLVGAIPGTSHSLSPTIMLVLIALICWVIIMHFTNIRIVRTRIVRRLQISYNHKQNLPKRRFGQI